MMIFKLAALIFASTFFGAALYINLVAQPARLALEYGPLLAEWKLSYKRGTAMQVPLVILIGICGVSVFVLDHNPLWLIGALFILANGPWTLLFILPTNQKLMNIASDNVQSEVRTLIRRWGKLHGVRTLLGLLSALCFGVAIYQG